MTSGGWATDPFRSNGPQYQSLSDDTTGGIAPPGPAPSTAGPPRIPRKSLPSALRRKPVSSNSGGSSSRSSYIPVTGGTVDDGLPHFVGGQGPVAAAAGGGLGSPDDPAADRRFTPSPLSEPRGENNYASLPVVVAAAAPAPTDLNKDGPVKTEQELRDDAGGTPNNAFDPANPPAWLGQSARWNAKWRPSYLRPAVFIIFIVFFLTCIVAIELLYAFSQRNHGISAPGEQLYYLWTFGPTAVLIILSALWARVEFQMMRYMPWMAMMQGPSTPQQSILVDYVSMFSLAALWRSLKNRHFLLAMVVTVSVLFKVEIILSTSLLSLQDTRYVLSDVPIATQTSFKDFSTVDIQEINQGPSIQYQIPSIPYLLLETMKNYSLPNPPGYSNGTSFQVFNSPDADPATVVEATVDSFAMDVDCVEPKVAFHNWRLQQTSSLLPSYNMIGNMSIETPSCAINISMFTGALIDSCATTKPDELQNVWYLKNVYWDFFTYYNCFPNGTYLTAVASFELGSTSANASRCGDITARATDLTAFLCTPKYAVTKATVSKNASTVHSLALQGPQNWTPVGRLGDFVSKAFADNFYLYGTTWSRGAPTIVMYGRGAITGDSGTGFETYDKDTILASVRKTQQVVGAMVGNVFFVDSTPGNVTGTAFQNSKRLVVNPVTSHVMSGLFLLMVAFASWNLVSHAKFSGFAPRDPNTMAGTAALLANSPLFLAQFRQTSQATAKEMGRRFGAGTYQSYYTLDETQRPGFIVAKTDEGRPLLPAPEAAAPPRRDNTYYWPWCLHPGAQVAALVLLLALIALLIGLQQVSDRNAGIADLTGRDETYLHYLWTSLPTLVMVGVSLFFSACNFETRVMVPFSRMKTATHQDYANTIGLTFLDETPIATLYRLVGRRVSVRVLLTTLMSLLAGVLTIFSSTLFFTSDVAGNASVQLQQTQWLATENSSAPIAQAGVGSGTGLDGPEIVASMALSYGLTYPPWTYRDLVFPAFAVAAPPADGKLQPSTVDAVLPAVRPESTCTFHTALKLNYSDVDPRYRNKRLKITLLDKPDCYFTPSPSSFGYLENLADQYAWSFSHVYTTAYIDPSGNCSDMVYVWGTRHFRDDRDFTAALLCNDTASFVSVNTTLKYPSLLIDNDRPPAADESTRRPFGPGKLRGAQHGTNFFDGLLPPPAALDLQQHRLAYNLTPAFQGFDDFFQIVAGSAFAVPPEHFRTNATAQEVIDAVVRQYNVIRAQTVSLGNATRLTFAQRSPNPPFTQAQPAPLTATADVTRRRLLQNPTPTYLLVGLLTVVLLLHMASLWPQDRRVVLANPLSLAAAAALLADSNDVVDHLPRGAGAGAGAEWLTDEQLRRAFDGKLFRLGWWQDLKDPAAQTFAIRMFDAGDRIGAGSGGGVKAQHQLQTEYQGAGGGVGGGGFVGPPANPLQHQPYQQYDPQQQQQYQQYEPQHQQHQQHQQRPQYAAAAWFPGTQNQGWSSVSQNDR